MCIKVKAPFLCLSVVNFNQYLGNAIQIGHLLGLSYEREVTKHSWESEKSRRRFWACYLIHCHSSESIFTPAPDGAFLKLQLPWLEEDFDAGLSSRPSVCLESGQSNGGVFCELIKALTLW